MKVLTTPTNHDTVKAFLLEWISLASPRSQLLMTLDECPPLDFECDAAELDAALDELRRTGPTESIKRIFQGDMWYRTDTARCVRCYRYRPEVYYDFSRDVESVCNRCAEVLNE